MEKKILDAFYLETQEEIQRDIYRSLVCENAESMAYTHEDDAGSKLRKLFEFANLCGRVYVSCMKRQELQL